MRLLLCSDFSNVGYKYLSRFGKNLKNKNCLFVGYAQEDKYELDSSAAKKLKQCGLNLISLDKNYDFHDKIDMIFVRGGNTTMLIDKLREYKQFEKIKQMARSGVIYVGNSAGAILVGEDTAWTLESEPYSVDLIKKYGKNALFGFEFVKKRILVHCSRYRFCRDYERTSDEDLFRVENKELYSAYLNEKKGLKKDEYIKIGNNQVYFVDGEKQKIITFDWKHFPVKI